MPSLVVSLAGKPHATYAINRPRTCIGRSVKNDIVLDGRTVSSAHAMLVQLGDKLAIEDLGSSNGTFLGRTRIERADLEDGSMVSIGEFTLKLVAHRAAMAYEPTMMVRPSASARKAYLQRLGGTSAGEVIAPCFRAGSRRRRSVIATARGSWPTPIACCRTATSRSAPWLRSPRG